MLFVWGFGFKYPAASGAFKDHGFRLVFGWLGLSAIVGAFRNSRGWLWVVREVLWGLC